MFVGPVIINSSFKNSEHPLYYPVLILGILICLFSMFFFFKGLTTMVSGFFTTLIRINNEKVFTITCSYSIGFLLQSGKKMSGFQNRYFCF
ncbi:DUF6095 family protein [Myroides ceti]|uniref:DUF6095 family protein n=2 Tax=Paenimyroides ceti TaxID=395087 RepID=A0ABT8D1R6_9FLAO|nr:DUF6095 family protein [Paenimyroides ceti]MDN3710266.1 DUF6095 family protein [Paenimyroides ceti]